jgi:hypothetical protein
MRKAFILEIIAHDFRSPSGNIPFGDKLCIQAVASIIQINVEIMFH